MKIKTLIPTSIGSSLPIVYRGSDAQLPEIDLAYPRTPQSAVGLSVFAGGYAKETSRVSSRERETWGNRMMVGVVGVECLVFQGTKMAHESLPRSRGAVAGAYVRVVSERHVQRHVEAASNGGAR